ncbi:MAG: efflux RND transporter periplasmic adaptor subunit [Smithella sp.]|jgi:HlyD family secretion protein
MNAKQDKETDIAKVLEVDNLRAKQKIPKMWIIAAVLASVIIIVAVFWRGSHSSNAVQYKTEEVKRGNLTVIVTATGTLKPTNNEVAVGSELSGTIKTVEVDYNSKVKVGQILARLDTTKLEAQVIQYRASLEAAQAKVLETQATIKEARSKLAQYQRVRALSNNKVPSQTDIDAQEATLERAIADDASARASVSQAKATLATYETDLSKSVIRSPINGVVLTRDVEPGQTVAAAMTAPTLFTLASDLTKMELHVNVDEADVSNIKEGQNATFSVAAYPNRAFDARIVRANYGSTTTSGVVTYETVLKVDNSDLLLRPGMTATADIVVKKIENALLIPSAALRFTPSLQEEKKSSGGLVSSILPHPPGSGNRQQGESGNKKRQNVWILKNEKLSDVSIIIGSANGGMTEVLSGDIQQGEAVVVDTITAVK